MSRSRIRTVPKVTMAVRLLLLGLLTCGALVSAGAAEAPASSEQSKPSADVILQNGMAAARSSAKAGFFDVSAPGCGWCRRMDQLFNSGEAADVLRKYYVNIPVNLVDNAGTAELAKKFGRKEDEGTPWFVVLDADGKILATSDATGENLGFPGNEKERATFLSILRSTAKGITAEELTTVENGLKGAVAKPAVK